MAQKTMSWDLPTTYEDGSPIDPADVPNISVQVYKDGVHVYSTINGATEWPIEVNYGETNDWTLRAILNGQISQESAPYRYTLPFRIPSPPTVLGVG